MNDVAAGFGFGAFAVLSVVLIFFVVRFARSLNRRAPKK
jgi:membrane protein implicated in regulation of membrane protease activity